MRRLLTAGAGVGVIGAAAYKPFYDPVKYKNINEINDSYDYIIIGAGTTGSIVARRLCEQAHKPSVLLLEAGGPDRFHPLSSHVIPAAVLQQLKSDVDWQFYTEPNENACKGLIDHRSYWPRGKCIGGSSVLNGMMYVRGHPNDYNEWDDEYGCNGWSYKDVLPYFKKVEDPQFNISQNNKEFRGSGGPQKLCLKQYKDENNTKATDLFIKACTNLGYQYNADYNGKSQDGVSLTQFNIYKGQRMTSFRSYIAPLFKKWTKKTDYNIDILPYSQVTKIVTKKNGNENKLLKADGIELVYKQDTKNKKIIKTNGEIILSAGAIGSPHVLLLSGIGPKDELKEQNIECVMDINGVGKNLQDHMMFSVKCSLPRDIPLLTKSEGYKIKTLMEYYLYGTGWLSTMSLDSNLFCKTETGKKLGIKTNDLQIIGCPAANLDDPTVARMIYHIDSDDENVAKIDERSDDFWSFVGLVIPLHQTSKGEVILNSNNPLEYPLINLEYLQSDYDKNCYIDGILLAKQIFNDTVYKDLGCKVIVNKQQYKNDEQYWSRQAILDRLQNTALTVYHPVGSCKMGDVENDEMAVCDERLKVRGFNNLRVMDASIMPILSSGNTQAPCYMIGEKGADMIIQDNINYSPI